MGGQSERNDTAEVLRTKPEQLLIGWSGEGWAGGSPDMAKTRGTMDRNQPIMSPLFPNCYTDHFPVIPSCIPSLQGSGLIHRSRTMLPPGEKTHNYNKLAEIQKCVHSSTEEEHDKDGHE